ncbi:M48 family metallopeptidase [bacterium]|nr:M48 family metallopeptidase [candidate division CSSED10-310 bacterium]
MDNQADSKVYNRAKTVVDIVELALSLVFLAVVVFAGLSVRLRDVVGGMHPNPYLRLLIFSGILAAANYLLFLPLSFYSGFVLEHRFRLSNQRIIDWIGDEGKQLGLSLLFMVPLLTVFYFLLRTLGHHWWLPMACILFVFSILLSWLAPVIIMPLFYEFTEVDDSILTERLTTLSRRLGVTVQSVLSFNMSAKTRKGNAALAGLGKTRRILIGDTLLELLDHDEIEAVFAHELGHHALRHMPKGIAMGFLNIFTGMGLVAYLYYLSLGYFGFTGIDDLAALPLLLLYLFGFMLVALPIQNAISRRFEFEADSFAILHAAFPASFFTGMRKLESLNLDDPDPHPLIEWYFYSHPSLGRRLGNARDMLES